MSLRVLAMLVLVAPVVLWARHGTSITIGDLVRVAFPPLVSTLLAAAIAFLLSTSQTESWNEAATSATTISRPIRCSC